MKHLIKTATKIDGVFVYERSPIIDQRGLFERLFCTTQLAALGMHLPIRQINFSSTNKKGVVRGLHFQTEPHMETKLVSCLTGRIFDVAVDLRKDSPTFMQYHGEVLDENNRRTLVIPEGCAHGFQTLTDNCELLYLHTADYHPASESGINALDDDLAIQWPEEIIERSDKDIALYDIAHFNNKYPS